MTSYTIIITDDNGEVLHMEEIKIELDRVLNYAQHILWNTPTGTLATVNPVGKYSQLTWTVEKAA